MARHVHIYLSARTRARDRSSQPSADAPSDEEVEQARRTFQQLREAANRLAGDPSSTGRLKLNSVREKMQQLRFQFGAMIATDARPCGCGH